MATGEGGINAIGCLHGSAGYSNLDIQITNASLNDIAGALSATLEEGNRKDWLGSEEIQGQQWLPLLPCH